MRKSLRWPKHCQKAGFFWKEAAVTLKVTVAEVQAPERHAEQMAARIPDSSRCACTAGQLPTMPETPNEFCVTEQEERKQTSKEVVARAVELLEPTSVELAGSVQ